MKPTLDYILTQLSATFKVTDIMVPTEILVRANNELEQTQKVASEHPQYDVIPIPATGPLTHYYDRQRDTIKPIKFGDLISDGN